ncbi:MAG: DUF1624 domain-containing protein [Candidatus Kapabacteria bacterium]|nr:DUF1624 domain-containing protein [Ignavibacteriota bacterium]MCW5884461.1 DUF1624 domain-containing protein [Candidatus Kapabacteria bacterium]
MQNNQTTTLDHSKQSSRLLFIDVMRAYAILMMIQGHWVDAMIEPALRDSSNWIFAWWDHMRGITAPVFFFSSGTIFSYLLLRKKLPIAENDRFFKGIKRVFLLLLIGYLLRFNPSMLFDLDNFSFTKYSNSFAVDALHCIAFGLGLVIISYLLHKITRVYIWIYFFIFAFMSFYLYPEFRFFDWLNIFPLPIANYFTKEYGSGFPIVPWAGFVLWGALLGYLLSKRVNIAFNRIFALVMLALGLLLRYYSGSMLDFLFNITGDSNFHYLLHHNFLYFHLGNTFIVLGILALISNYIKIPPILSSVGKKTMMIYVIHIFVIYGTAYNHGFQYYIGKSQNYTEVIISAIGIVLFFILLVYVWEKVEKLLVIKYPKYFGKKL